MILHPELNVRFEEDGLRVYVHSYRLQFRQGWCEDAAETQVHRTDGLTDVGGGGSDNHENKHGQMHCFKSGHSQTSFRLQETTGGVRKRSETH